MPITIVVTVSNTTNQLVQVVYTSSQIPATVTSINPASSGELQVLPGSSINIEEARVVNIQALREIGVSITKRSVSFTDPVPTFGTPNTPTLFGAWGVTVNDEFGIELEIISGGGGAGFFEIQRSPDGSSNWSTIDYSAVTVEEGETQTYADYPLAASTTWYYRVRATDLVKTNVSEWSEIANATTFNAVTSLSSAENDDYAVSSWGPGDATSVVFQFPPGVRNNDIQDPSDIPLIPSTFLVADARHGNITLETDGGFTYSPDQSFVGIDVFYYQNLYSGYTNAARVRVFVGVT